MEKRRRKKKKEIRQIFLFICIESERKIEYEDKKRMPFYLELAYLLYQQMPFFIEPNLFHDIHLYSDKSPFNPSLLPVFK